jgi:enoyl-CoA hydratase/carnithine racemase
MIDAEAAFAAGLVDEVVDDALLRERTRELAAAIAAHSPVALRLIKDAVRTALDAPLSAGLRHERELFVTAFASEDRTEGVAAFLEKRAAEFTGR